ncbi:MAG: DUF1501 domain-containing protein [Planctomycetia bacterium]|nr:DUF1501 domain-containing protein [Planctomycetia bacterium]
MLTLSGRGSQTCDRVARRDFLRLGGFAAGGLALPDILRLRAESGARRSRKSVILIHMMGGPSQIDTFDMKPRAPNEYRGEFRPIETNVPGLEICELMPRLARMADKFAVVRDLQFHNELPQDHDPQEVFSGFAPKHKRPPLGAIVSRIHPPSSAALPPYVSLCNHAPSILQRVHPEDPLYVGAGHRPFEPISGQMAHRQIQVTPERLQDRASLLKRLDNMRRDIDQRGNMAGMDEYTRRALAMLTSPEVLEALDVAKEPAKVRERYGPDRSFYASSFDYSSPISWLTTKFLMARRLVEAGVPVVSLNIGSWDHHGILSNGPRSGVFPRLREELPWFDQAFSALVLDLEERGLLDDVAIVAWGEMGRTPRINRQAGRDHWQESGFALLAGGGLRTGQAIGSTDKYAARPRGNPHSAENVFATLYHVLGIDTRQTIPDLTGRPQFLLDDQKPIRELI